ncbi:hypothetical protein [Laceyella putida]|uniref:Uncharacterized protein n=1 Tax=Laceyella putida TaxID=110101 RepID=A0ABW2RFM1_9BACL
MMDRWKRFFQSLWSQVKSRTGIAGVNMRALFLVMLCLALACVTPAMARWSDRVLLPNLASLNIFQLTRELSAMTDGMIVSTDQLKQEVDNASHSLDALSEQEEKLTGQAETNRSIQRELGKQLAGNQEARKRMEAILSRQEQTYGLTKEAAIKAGDISAQMGTTIDHLERVAVQTGQVGSNTAKLNGQMDSLLVELDESIDNFKFVANITEALRILRQPSLSAPLSAVSKVLPKGPLKEGVETVEKEVLSPIEESLGLNKEKERSNQGSGLLDLLLP